MWGAAVYQGMRPSLLGERWYPGEVPLPQRIVRAGILAEGELLGEFTKGFAYLERIVSGGIFVVREAYTPATLVVPNLHSHVLVRDAYESQRMRGISLREFVGPAAPYVAQIISSSGNLVVPTMDPADVRVSFYGIITLYAFRPRPGRDLLELELKLTQSWS